MVALSTHTTALTDLHGHRAGNIVARREVFVLWRITLHKAFAFGVCQIAALAACALGDQAA